MLNKHRVPCSSPCLCKRFQSGTSSHPHSPSRWIFIYTYVVDTRLYIERDCVIILYINYSPYELNTNSLMCKNPSRVVIFLRSHGNLRMINNIYMQRRLWNLLRVSFM